MRWSKRVVPWLVLAAVAAAIAYGFLPQPVLVETAPVVRGPLAVTVEEEGKTRVIDRYVVSAPVAGFARRIDLDVGDPVARGQGLVALEPLRSNVLDPRSRAQAEARIAAAEASLRVAEENTRAAAADADFAQADVERVRRLFQSRGTSRENLEQAEAEARRANARLRSAEFAVQVARSELEAARTALRYSAAEANPDTPEQVVVRSPVDGRVLKVFRKSAGVVNAGESLVEVGDPNALEVEVDLLSADAVRVRPGTRVLFDRWGGEGTLEGRVRVVEPSGFTKISALGVEEQRVWVIADITSPPEIWSRLGDGYRVEASFVLWEGDNVLQVPTSALFRYGKGWAVFVVKGGRAQRRQVQVGHRSGLAAEIVAGLVVGETVVTHPNEAVEDGVRLEVR